MFHQISPNWHVSPSRHRCVHILPKPLGCQTRCIAHRKNCVNNSHAETLKRTDISWTNWRILRPYLFQWGIIGGMTYSVCRQWLCSYFNQVFDPRHKLLGPSLRHRGHWSKIAMNLIGGSTATKFSKPSRHRCFHILPKPLGCCLHGANPVLVHNRDAEVPCQKSFGRPLWTPPCQPYISKFKWAWLNNDIPVDPSGRVVVGKVKWNKMG